MSEAAARIGISGNHLTSLNLAESASVAPSRAAWLLVETVAVTTAAVLTIRLLAETSLHESLWFLSPMVLVAAALIPPVVTKGRFPKIGLNKRKTKELFWVLVCTCAVAFGATLFGLWLIKLYGFKLPLRFVPQGNRQLLSWLLYQFLYVAVAEEVFFRGYLQSNILRLTATIKQVTDRPSLRNWTSIILSALCFAAAHVIVQGQAASVLTFLPGLALGWLFIRTKSLLAPILFHGLANTFYCICTALLA